VREECVPTAPDALLEIRKPMDLKRAFSRENGHELLGRKPCLTRTFPCLLVRGTSAAFDGTRI
jgi:hypothetical protein